MHTAESRLGVDVTADEGHSCGEGSEAPGGQRGVERARSRRAPATAVENAGLIVDVLGVSSSVSAWAVKVSV